MTGWTFNESSWSCPHWRKYWHENTTTRNPKSTNIEEIKSACAKTYSSGISADKVRIAVQIVYNELYHHKYYLSKEGQLNSVDVDQVSMDISCSEPIAKCACSETNSKAPKTSNDYEIYKYVLPLAKIIWNYQNFQAIQEETNASIKLFKKCSDEKKQPIVLIQCCCVM